MTVFDPDCKALRPVRTADICTDDLAVQAL